MSMQLLIGATAVIGSIVALWWGMTSRPSAAHSNLVAGLVDDDVEESPPLVTAIRTIGSAARRRLPGFLVDGLEVNLVQAGYPSGLDLPRLLGLKVVLAATAALLISLSGHFVTALIVAAVLFFIPDYWVLSARDKRQAGLQLGLADAVDQMTICVEAGLGFDAALARVARSSDGPLGQELRHTLSDISAGVPRAQALRALGDRAQVPEVRQLVSALLQAQKHGVSIAETLRVQAGEMRLKRRQRTEERAAKLPVKLLFPIVACYLPVFMIIVLVPSLVSIFRAL